MPVVDQLAADYADEVTFLAIAWRGSLDDTRSRAESIMPSGLIRWGLDADESIFEAYGVPYQPVTVLVTHDKIVKTEWPGLKAEDEMRAEIEALIATSG